MAIKKTYTPNGSENGNVGKGEFNSAVDAINSAINGISTTPPDGNSFSTGNTLVGTTLTTTLNNGNSFNVELFNLSTGGTSGDLWKSGAAEYSIVANNNSGTEATGEYSHAIGAGTLASGENSNAQGSNTIASGTDSHAEGNSSFAVGYASHSQGHNTLAVGSNSHSQGYFTHAFGPSSHSGGRGYDDIKKISSSGQSAFNHSTTNNSFTGDGAAADHSVILGGLNHSIPSGFANSAIIGGNAITATVANTVYMPKLETDEIGEGVIMKSPDGTRYKFTIANGGTVSIVAA